MYRPSKSIGSLYTYQASEGYWEFQEWFGSSEVGLGVFSEESYGKTRILSGKCNKLATGKLKSTAKACFLSALINLMFKGFLDGTC